MTDPKKSPPKGLMDEDGRLAKEVVLDDKEESTSVSWAMVSRIASAMIVLVALVALSYSASIFEFARPWKRGDPVPFWNLIGRPFETAQVAEKSEKTEKVDSIARDALANEAEPEIKVDRDIVAVDPGDQLPPYVPHPDDKKPVEQPLELFTGHELDGFFESLARTDVGIEGEITRAVHWGDSAIGVDGITSAIRKRMQARFGDAGHGYHVMAPPNTSYRHRGVKFSHNEEWDLCFIIQKCRKDGRYGLGGTTTRSYGGAVSSFAPDPKHSSGHVSRFEIWYSGDPKGGRVRYRVDREEPVIFDTESEQLGDQWKLIEVEDGPHKLKVEAIGGGKARLFGVVLERDGPGVVWDGMALVGAFTKRMLAFDQDHLSSQLQHRESELAVFMFGGNDMIRERMTMEQFEGEYGEVVQNVKDARPGINCLIMSPLDHGLRQGSRIVSRPIVPKMVEAQRNVAKKHGCAFYDTYSAMGGDGSAGRWFRQTPRLVGGDLSHMTHKGQIVIGEMFYRALMQAYVAHRTGQAPPAMPVPGTETGTEDATDNPTDDPTDDPTDATDAAAGNQDGETGTEDATDATGPAPGAAAEDPPALLPKPPGPPDEGADPVPATTPTPTPAPVPAPPEDPAPPAAPGSPTDPEAGPAPDPVPEPSPQPNPEDSP
jgi:lysophospholipase L1-like esterase